MLVAPENFTDVVCRSGPMDKLVEEPHAPYEPPACLSPGAAREQLAGVCCLSALVLGTSPEMGLLMNGGNDDTDGYNSTDSRE
jgi:hypothetical protein